MEEFSPRALDLGVRETVMGASGERASDRLSETWRAFVGAHDGADAGALRALPREVGLPVGDDGEAWDRFVRLPPNRALPRFALPDALRDRVTEASLAAFVRAHHHAAYFGIVADRIADLQVARSEALVRARTVLLRAWERALTDAMGEAPAARSLIAEDLRGWRRGLRMEGAAFAARALAPDRYFATVAVRLRWISTSARAMLHALGARDAAGALGRACDLFLFACQCRDDALDADEDRRARGASVPELLGMSPGALVRAAVTMLRRAEEAARGGGLRELAAWLRGFAREADVWWEGEPPILQTMGAMVITEAAWTG